MKKFGEVKYAVLCKSQVDDGPPHKGTGFVRFKNESSAVQLLELSQQVEGTMDKERKANRLQQNQKESVISSLSLLKNEIELDGRRLIVKPKVSKEDADNIKEKQKSEEIMKKKQEDNRNLQMAKEGLLCEENWIHQPNSSPAVLKSAMELRQRLYVSKDKALKASTNLYVSKTRLQIRNLPRREFFEPELKELMRVVAEEWSHTLDDDERKRLYKNKKLLQYCKVMRDDQKTDVVTNENLASGQAFVEFTNEDLALYAVRYLNNFEILKKRGLIADFSMEDQRALFKRKEKIERHRKLAKDTKRE